jgi:hypothetical protein
LGAVVYGALGLVAASHHATYTDMLRLLKRTGRKLDMLVSTAAIQGGRRISRWFTAQHARRQQTQRVVTRTVGGRTGYSTTPTLQKADISSKQAESVSPIPGILRKGIPDKVATVPASKLYQDLFNLIIQTTLTDYSLKFISELRSGSQRTSDFAVSNNLVIYVQK